MSKTIGLKQLAQKSYTHLEGFPPALMQSLGGKIEDAFDCVIWGQSGHGKSSFSDMLVMALIKSLKCKCEYVAYEEGHGFTIQERLINRSNMLEEVGNAIQITDHLTYAEIKAKMARRKSPKIWVIDSIQDSPLTSAQCSELKKLFVLSKKKKIIIYISWCKGKWPMGSAAYDTMYLANMKLFVEGYIVFPRSRFGGNLPFVIWQGDNKRGAKGYWGDDYSRISKGLAAATKADKKKDKKADKTGDKPEPVTKMQVLPGAPKPVFKEPLNDAI